MKTGWCRSNNFGRWTEIILLLRYLLLHPTHVGSANPRRGRPPTTLPGLSMKIWLYVLHRLSVRRNRFVELGNCFPRSVSSRPKRQGTFETTWEDRSIKVILRRDDVPVRDPVTGIHGIVITRFSKKESSTPSGGITKTVVFLLGSGT